MAITDEQVKAAELAVDRETMRQYDESKGWEEAKDVIENLDCKSIAIEAIRAADAAAWRPIEEAPKDGSAILVWSEGNNTRLVAWDDWVSKWIISGGDSDFLRYEPTHFRPLPEPPK